MADKISFELVSPERRLTPDGMEADMVTVPGMEGDLGAMPDHAPFLTTLRPGYVIVHNGSDETRYIVTGGFAEISDNTVSVLAEQSMDDGAATSEWLETQIAEAKQALETIGEDRKTAATQRLADLESLR